ncbi:NACHT domain-containing protein (plasmid) [Streptomyces sp. NBC_00597]|uniref:NACHT domain-containing protein n=1 Tax=unclassified Streptomyces TaxID=2593676 RepID=UPI002E36A8FA|nr:NACHT domain-containing protein [Streptomyces sp. NBC_01278]
MTTEAAGGQWPGFGPGTVINLAVVKGDHNVQNNYFITKDPDPVESATRHLAGLVWEQWHHEAELRDLFPVPIPVLWRMTDGGNLGDHDHLTGAPMAGSASDLDSFARSFSQRQPQRLTILGGAGSGKTTMAVLLVLELLRQMKGGDRVPVLLPLASWRPAEEHPKSWLIRQIVDTYPFLSARTVRDLLNRRRILPVLDGLDELPDLERPLALRKLNSGYPAHEPLVLTCRTHDYAKAIKKGPVLRSAPVVEGRPLTAEAVAGYLLDHATPQQRDRWRPLTDAVTRDPDGPAAQALSVPLLLWLCGKVHEDPDQDRNPGDLANRNAFPTPEKIEQHLLDSLVPAVYPSDPRDSPHPDRRAPRRWARGHGPREAERAARWLGHLARHLTKREQTDLKWWELGTTMHPSARMTVIGCAAGICVGAVVFLVDTVFVTVFAARPGWGFPARLAKGLLVGLADALINGPPAALLFGLAHRVRRAFVGAAVEPSRMRIGTRGRSGAPRTRSVRDILKQVRTGSLAGFAGGAGIGLLFGLWGKGVGDSRWFEIGLVAVMVYGAQFGLVFGLVSGLVAWLETPIDTDSAVRPRGLLATDRNNVLVQLLLLGPLAGVTVMVGSRLIVGFLGGSLWGVPVTAEPVWTIRFALLTALAGGLGAALSMTAWGEWVVLAHVWLPLTGRLPWRAMAFLEDAHQERGVLRQAGAVFQFRHARLQERLARPAEAGADDRS